ncbi:MAG TPA: hypothetical protein VLC92_07580 [Rhodocyclaceae bacterium]|nr:hypothetical protein [Rhodocyclaceae bacterium]
MTHIITTSMRNFRRNRALWLYLLIFAAAISMALFAAAAQAHGLHFTVIPAQAGIQCR